MLSLKHLMKIKASIACTNFTKSFFTATLTSFLSCFTAEIEKCTCMKELLHIYMVQTSIE